MMLLWWGKMKRITQTSEMREKRKGRVLVEEAVEITACFETRVVDYKYAWSNEHPYVHERDGQRQ